MSSPAPTRIVSSRRRWSAALWMVARTAVGIGLLAYVLRAGGTWVPLKSLFGYVWLVVLLNAVPLAGAAIEAARLSVLFRAQRLGVPFALGFRVVAIGTLFNLWIPGGTGGDVMKLYYLTQRHQGRGIEVATILLVDRAMALLALLVFILGLLAWQLPHGGLSPVLTGAAVATGGALLAMMLIGAIALSGRVRANRAVRAVATRLPMQRQVRRAADAVQAYRRHTPALARAGALSLGGHVLTAAVFAVIGTVLLPGVPTLLVSTLALLALLANVLPLTPGGVGVGEAAAEALFRAAGIPGGGAVVAAWRGGTVAISALGAFFYIRGAKRPAPVRRDERACEA